MSRPSRAGMAQGREKLRSDFTHSAPLRQLYPQLAELRVEFEFQDGTTSAPSAQSFSYFPAARGFFRYACPCHSCSGEFDLSAQVAELACSASAPRTRRMKIPCKGERARQIDERVACPISAHVRVSAILRGPE